MELVEESNLQLGNDTSAPILNIIVKSESDHFPLNSESFLCDDISLPTTAHAIQLETDLKLDCPNFEGKPARSADSKPVLVQPAVFAENYFNSEASTSGITETNNGISECYKKETSDSIESESFAQVSDVSGQEEDYEKSMLANAEEEFTEIYTCGTCNNHSFKSVQHLRAHIRQNHFKGEIISFQEKLKTQKKKRKKRRNVAANPDKVESHRFPAERGDVAVCSICHQTFTDLSDLRTHITVHDKPYARKRLYGNQNEVTLKVKKFALICTFCDRPIPAGLIKAHRIVCTAKRNTDLLTMNIRCETFGCFRSFFILSKCLEHREMCIRRYCCLCFPDYITIPLYRCKNSLDLSHHLSLFDHIFRVHFADKMLDNKLRCFIIKLICSKQMEEDLHSYILAVETNLDLFTINSLLKPLDLLKIANGNLETSQETNVSTNNQKFQEDGITSKKSTEQSNVSTNIQKLEEDNISSKKSTEQSYVSTNIQKLEEDNSSSKKSTEQSNVSTNIQKLEEDNISSKKSTEQSNVSTTTQHCDEDKISPKKSTAGGPLIVCEEKVLENGCELCTMTFKTFDELSIHYFQHENSTKGVRLKCERCDLEFLERSVFRKHRSQPHLIFCKWCQKRFRKQSTYHIHVQNKHTESCAELGIKAFDPLFCSVKLEPAD